MEDTGLDFSGCAEGLSFGADLSFQNDIGISPETCFQDGGEFSFQQPETDQLQFPSRLPRQLLQTRAPRTNQLGGVVLQAPGAPGRPLQTLTPAQQTLHSSLTTVNSPGYQVQPGYHAHPVNIQQPPYSSATGISVTHQGFPLQSVQAMNQVQQTTTVVSGVMPFQRPGPVVVPQIPPSNWMGLSIFSVIFCTLPFGIIALLFSFLVNDSYRRGQYERAQKNSDIAKWMNVLSIISGTALSCVIIYLIIRPL